MMRASLSPDFVSRERMGRRGAGVLLLFFCVVGLFACARPSAPPPVEEKAGKRVPYVVGIPDVLRISVWRIRS